MIIRDHTNKRYGRLIALEPTDMRQGRKIVWKCLCDCGTVAYVSGSALGINTNSCGCAGSDKRPLEKRFHERYRVDAESGCWLWTSHINRDGYGHITVRTKVVMGAHRASWILHHGEVPEGMCVCHKCDTPACVNPDHLFLGTHQENMADMFGKGRRRAPRAELNPRAKLTSAQVLSIVNDRRRQVEIAAEYGITQSRVSAIKRGGWKSYVPMPPSPPHTDAAEDTCR
jgi:predicted XRE-type DNA-binding protein